MDARTLGAGLLALATAALLASYGRDSWIIAVGGVLLGLLGVGWFAFRLLARELQGEAPRPAPTRRMVQHRGLLASGLAAAGTSCLLAAALVTRHATSQWGLLYWLLALLMIGGIVAIRVSYHAHRRT